MKQKALGHSAWDTGHKITANHGGCTANNTIRVACVLAGLKRARAR